MDIDTGVADVAQPPRRRRRWLLGGVLILLERREAQMPYFALWVDNAKSLTAFQ